MFEFSSDKMVDFQLGGRVGENKILEFQVKILSIYRKQIFDDISKNLNFE